MAFTKMADVPNPVTDANGDPYSGAVLKAYLPGTTTSTSIYISTAGSSPQATITANADGIWEVSGNEVIPYIDRKHKWGIFANAADATANTPFYMGPFDNVEQISEAANTALEFDTVAAMVASSSLSIGQTIKTLGYYAVGDGGENTYEVVAAATGTADGGRFIDLATHQAKGLFPTGKIWVKQFGAYGDKTNLDDTAFDNAYAYAKTSSGVPTVYLNPLPLGNYYKKSTAWVLDTQSSQVYGAHHASCIVQTGAANGITIQSSALHCVISDVSLVGTTGSVHGIQITGTSHYGKIHNVYIGYFDGAGLKVTSGQTWVFNLVEIDQNVGYVPITLASGTLGAVANGIDVEYSATGDTNNQTFTGCRLNAAGSAGNPQLQVGDAANPVGVTSFSWFGGVIQGTATNEMLYAKCDEFEMIGCHIETTQNGTDYAVTIDSSRSARIRDSFILGDINMAASTGTNRYCLFDNISGVGGINIASSTANSTFRDVIYRNSTNGPTSGNVINATSDTVFENVNSLTGVQNPVPGKQGRDLSVYFKTDMTDWVGGGSPTVPCGFASAGGTITKNAATVRTGTHSASVVYSTDNTQGLQMSLGPTNRILQNRRVYVSAWVNVSANETAGINWFDGTTNTRVDSTTTGAWERIYASFYASTADSAAQIKLTGSNGATVYWDDVEIWVEEYDPITEVSVASAATLQIASNTDQGHWVPQVEVTGTTGITAFEGLHVGKPVTFRFASTATVTASASILLTASPFNATADDTLTMIYGDDGIFREIGRSVL